jgi:hypothetical protein
MNNIDRDKSNEMSDLINRLIKTTENMKVHYKMLFSDNIITSGEYYLKMDKLKELRKDLLKNENILKLIEEFGINILHLKLDNVSNKLQKIKDELDTLIKENGFISVTDIMDMFLIKKNEKDDISKKIGSINNFFIVTSFKDYVDDNTEDKNEKMNIEKKGLDFLMLSDCKELTIYETDDVLHKLKNHLKKKLIKIDISNEFYKKEEGTKKFNEFVETTEGEISLKNNFVNLIYELNKASIRIEINDDLYIFSGYFREDTFNEIYINDAFEGKYLEIINYYKGKDIQPDNYDKYKLFVKEYMNQYSVKDFIIKSTEKIIAELENEYYKNIEISKKVIQELVDMITSSDIYNKRQLIIHGLINDNCRKNDNNDDDENTYDFNPEIKLDINIKYESIKDIKYTKLKDNKKQKKGEKLSAYMKSPKIQNVRMNKVTASRYAINSLMRNMDGNNGIEVLVYNSNKTINSNILLDFLRNNVLKGVEFNILRKSIHYNLRKKIFIKDNDKSQDKTKEEMSWEMKLDTLDITEMEKGKVMEKIKEFRNGKENSKAENYIDNFFQIPFGKYIKEDIFEKCIESNEKIDKYLKMLNKGDTDTKIYKNDTIDSLILKQKQIGVNYGSEILGYFINERDNIKKTRKHYLEYVKQVLDNAIYGHIDSKRQIKREIGKWLSSGCTEGMILGFHGPPGVGKTTLARQGISKCLVDNDGNFRPFNMIQLGGQNDGSTFSGHNYTYVGSKPGDLLEALKKSKCMNPILFFDELDKVSDDIKGKDVISILIHLTDKSQNTEMHDKFFSGINFDFSKCIIIFSYNDRNLINKTLRDRITEIKVEPLKTHEKIEVVKQFTLKDIEKRLNFACDISDDLIRYVSEKYTMEAGVRKLNEKIEEIFAELNLKDLESDKFDVTKLDENKIDLILDRHTKILRNTIHSEPKPGFVNGLYATGVGIGGITLIQTDIRRMTEKKELEIKVTGKLGDVMKESVDCAKTIALNLLTEEERIALKKSIENEPFSLHIHCPDAATPKDGPSAGSTITLAIYSYLSKKNVRNDVAMTGEIDLYGKVKAIGGLSEKLNGAIKAGVKKVLFPKENEEDYKKIIRKNLLDGEIECVMISNFSQILEEALVKEPSDEKVLIKESNDEKVL